MSRLPMPNAQLAVMLAWKDLTYDIYFDKATGRVGIANLVRDGLVDDLMRRAMQVGCWANAETGRFYHICKVTAADDNEYDVLISTASDGSIGLTVVEDEEELDNPAIVKAEALTAADYAAGALLQQDFSSLPLRKQPEAMLKWLTDPDRSWAPFFYSERALGPDDTDECGKPLKGKGLFLLDGSELLLTTVHGPLVPRALVFTPLHYAQLEAADLHNIEHMGVA